MQKSFTLGYHYGIPFVVKRAEHDKAMTLFIERHLYHKRPGTTDYINKVSKITSSLSFTKPFSDS